MNNNYSNQSNNNNGGSDIFVPSIRSSYRFFNADSKLDKTALSFTYWNSLLKITMNPIEVQEGSATKVDTNNHIDIYLSPSKAQMLLHCIQRFRTNPDMFINLGVPTNKGIIFIANGEKMYGINGTFIVINLIAEDGSDNGKAAYQINTNMHGVMNYESGNKFEDYKDYSDSLELDMMETLLRSFIEAYTNAVASSVIDCNKVNDNRMFNFIKDAREKLGISKNEGNSKFSSKSSWYNNNHSSVSAESPKINESDYEDVVNEISSLMD